MMCPMHFQILRTKEWRLRFDRTHRRRARFELGVGGFGPVNMTSTTKKQERAR